MGLGIDRDLTGNGKIMGTKCRWEIPELVMFTRGQPRKIKVNNTKTENHQQTLELFFGDALDRLRGYLDVDPT